MSWNKLWETEKDRDFWKMPDKDIMHFMNRLPVNKNLSVLDYGCGIGRHAMLFAENGFNVTAIDESGNAIKYFRRRIESDQYKIKTIVSDLDIFINIRQFDIIIAYNVIYHNYRERIIEKLKQIKNIISQLF